MTESTHLHTSIQDDPQPFYDSIEQEELVNTDVGTYQQLLTNNYSHEKQKSIWNFVCIGIGVLALIAVVLVATFGMIYSTRKFKDMEEELKCSPQCRIQIVESMPDNLLELIPGTNSTYNAWIDIITNAKKTLHLAFFYSNLRVDAPKETGSWQGTAIFNALVAAKRERGVEIIIVQSEPDAQFPDEDTKTLQDMGVAKVISINWTKAFGTGILHTKLIIADTKNFYVGSANLDWTSLTQVKETGIHVSDCRCLAHDINKIFLVYSYLETDLHSDFSNFYGWPQHMTTRISEQSRITVNENANVFFSGSPRVLGAPGRTNDLDALLHTIRNATKTVSIEIMEYMPLQLYGPDNVKFYWDEIDFELKRAVVRNVTVKILVADWNHTHPGQKIVLKSLEAFGKDFCSHAAGEKKLPWCTGYMEIKMMKIPDPTYEVYPFTRVNHSKFVVTESQVYISTNNWSRDYFYSTGGISFVSDGKDTRNTLQALFDRDFNSKYSKSL